MFNSFTNFIIFRFFQVVWWGWAERNTTLGVVCRQQYLYIEIQKKIYMYIYFTLPFTPLFTKIRKDIEISLPGGGPSRCSTVYSIVQLTVNENKSSVTLHQAWLQTGAGFKSTHFKGKEKNSWYYLGMLGVLFVIINPSGFKYGSLLLLSIRES